MYKDARYNMIKNGFVIACTCRESTNASVIKIAKLMSAMPLCQRVTSLYMRKPEIHENSIVRIRPAKKESPHKPFHAARRYTYIGALPKKSTYGMSPFWMLNASYK